MIYLVFILGACLGSFINAVLYRLPRSIAVSRGRSFCPHCRQTLRWLDLMPLVSFLILRNRCRNCHQPISWSYFVVELVSALLAVIIWQVFSLNLWLFGFWLGTALLLLTLLLFDLKYLVLPDKILVTAGVFVIAVDMSYRLFQNRSIINYGSGLIGGLGLAIFFFIIWWLSRGRWIGLGDVKFALILGLIFGLVPILFITYTATIAGGLVAMALLLLRRANLKTQLPLGCFLSLAAIVFIIFRQPIINLINNYFF